MKTARIECLDGLRGLAALWVLLGHASLLSGWRIPLIHSPDLAVDLFMMLSGFLMAYHYMERRAREPWQAAATWTTFWTRRFFRIAPLYYLLLIAALLAGPSLGAARDVIAGAVPGTGTVDARYFDQSWQNLALHLSFVFGFSPAYGFRTALPDWSIGLEMAFYAAFPFLMLLVARFGFITMAIGVALLCHLLSAVFPGYFTSFQEPSMLALKLPIFLAGMLVAASLPEIGWRRLLLLAVAAVICLTPVRGAPAFGLAPEIRLLCLAILAILADCHRLPQWAGLHRIAPALSTLLGGRIATFLGDSSYGVYLLHLLVMLPVMQAIIMLQHPLSAPVLFFGTVAVVVPVVYLVAWLLHIAVERPGVQLGRRLLGAMRARAEMKKARVKSEFA
ncbi:MAG TPA: acyltransferase [Dongiaceae bacterium]|nr:acyltransferase [Dongiaceae bacterium]